MNFRAFDGFICLAQCGRQKKLILYIGNILCDHVGQGWSGKSKSKARQFEHSTYRWQIMRNFLMRANYRMMFGEAPNSWEEYLSDLADEIFQQEMLTVRCGSRTKGYVLAYVKMTQIFNREETFPGS